MSHKTKQGALKAARAAMGDEAIEGVDFNLHQTGAGWEHQAIPPANDAAATAQAARVTAKDVGGHPVEVDPADPLLVEGVVYPNKTRASEARRLIEVRTAHPKDPVVAAASVKNKRAARQDAAEKPAKAPKATAAPKAKAKAKKAPTPKPSAPDGQNKTDMLVAMLSTSGGATSKEMETATGWQSHSVRGLLGTLRKRGVNVVSKKLKGEPTIYRIAKGKPAPAAAPVQDSVGDVV